MATKRPKLDAAYNQAMSQGQDAADAFLAAHPNYARLAASQPNRNKPATARKIKDPVTRSIFKDSRTGALIGAQDQNKLNNITYTTPTTTGKPVYDSSGNIVGYDVLESDPQKNIRTTGEAITQQGQGLAQQGLSNYQVFQPGDYSQLKNQAYDTAYAQFTRDLDQDYTRELDQMEQTAYNRGIALNPNDPNYRRQREALDKRFDRAREEARQSAYGIAGGEAINAFNTGLTTHQQGLSDIGTLQSQGFGYQQSATPGYVAPQYNVANPADIKMAMDQLAQGNRALDIDEAYKMGMLQKAGGGGGSEAPSGPPISG